jgi:hypothetical protein
MQLKDVVAGVRQRALPLFARREGDGFDRLDAERLDDRLVGQGGLDFSTAWERLALYTLSPFQPSALRSGEAIEGVLMKRLILTFVAVFAGAQAAAAGIPSLDHEQGSNLPAAVTLRQDMRKLWTDHVIWTRDYIVAAVADHPGAQAAAGRLMKNQEDIGAAVAKYYEHILAMSDALSDGIIKQFPEKFAAGSPKRP